MEASVADPTVPRFINGEPMVGEDPAVEPQSDSVVQEMDDQMNDLEIQVANREWKVAGTLHVRNPRTQQDEDFPFEKTYYQKPLSYTAMLQFTGLIGERISLAMGQGVTLDSILGEVSGIAGAIRDSSVANALDGEFAGLDSFVSGLAKLAQHIPTIVEDCQCIWLRVPLNERAVVKEIWGYSPEDGGLSGQEGEEMLNLFIAQNYGELKSFFTERLKRVFAQAAAVNRMKTTTPRVVDVLQP